MESDHRKHSKTKSTSIRNTLPCSCGTHTWSLLLARKVKGDVSIALEQHRNNYPQHTPCKLTVLSCYCHFNANLICDNRPIHTASAGARRVIRTSHAFGAGENIARRGEQSDPALTRANNSQHVNSSRPKTTRPIRNQVATKALTC